MIHEGEYLDGRLTSMWNANKSVIDHEDRVSNGDAC